VWANRLMLQRFTPSPLTPLPSGEGNKINSLLVCRYLCSEGEGVDRVPPHLSIRIRWGKLYGLIFIPPRPSLRASGRWSVAYASGANERGNSFICISGGYNEHWSKPAEDKGGKQTSQEVIQHDAETAMDMAIDETNGPGLDDVEQTE